MRKRVGEIREKEIERRERQIDRQTHKQRERETQRERQRERDRERETERERDREREQQTEKKEKEREIYKTQKETTLTITRNGSILEEMSSKPIALKSIFKTTLKDGVSCNLTEINSRELPDL